MIEFRSVRKEYPGGTVAVDDFSLVLPPRTTTVLVGPSGCGKTTLLRMINRMVEPTSGSVQIDGADVAGRDPVRLRRSIGYVLQDGGLLPHQTVADNVATVLRLNRNPRSKTRQRTMELLETVGLSPDLAHRYPAQLSGGQQQRVGVARALAADPNILLMDEPFGAVDPIVRTELQAEILRLQQQLHKTVVFVTHDIEEAFLLGDQVVILREGAHIAQRGTPSQIIEDPADEFVAEFIGLTRGTRRLRAKRTANGTVLVDADGRTRGVLVGETDDATDGRDDGLTEHGADGRGDGPAEPGSDAWSDGPVAGGQGLPAEENG